MAEEEGSIDLEKVVAATRMQLTPKGMLLCEAIEAYESKKGRELTIQEGGAFSAGFVAGWRESQKVSEIPDSG